MDRLSDAHVDAYLDRIGVAGRPEPTPEALADLHGRHLRSVPFENLSIHLGERISLDLGGLFDKVVVRRRGGFCYELNGLFAALLTSLGYDVALLAASVYTPLGLTPPFDHMALAVGDRLADVGFGRHSVYPLRSGAGDQADPGGTFRVVRTDLGDLDVLRDGEPQYRLEPRPRALSDFGPACWWQETSPDSHFRAAPVCTLLTASAGLVTLAGRRLIVTEGGERTETTLGSDQAVLAAYREHFGLDLPRVPEPAGGGAGHDG